MSGMMDGGMMGIMMLGTLLFWTLVIVGVIWLARLLWQRTNNEQVVAVKILQERFARGEIDVEEYHQRHSVLQRRH